MKVQSCFGRILVSSLLTMLPLMAQAAGGNGGSDGGGDGKSGDAIPVISAIPITRDAAERAMKFCVVEKIVKPIIVQETKSVFNGDLLDMMGGVSVYDGSSMGISGVGVSYGRAPNDFFFSLSLNGYSISIAKNGTRADLTNVNKIGIIATNFPVFSYTKEFRQGAIDDNGVEDSKLVNLANVSIVFPFSTDRVATYNNNNGNKTNLTIDLEDYGNCLSSQILIEARKQK